jgi:hypothetical protein
MTTNATFELLQTLKLIAVPVDCQDVLCQFPVIPHYASQTESIVVPLHTGGFWFKPWPFWLLKKTSTFSLMNIFVHEQNCLFPIHCIAFFFIQESRSSSKITTCWYPARQPYNEWRIHTSSGTGPNSAWQLKPATKSTKPVQVAPPAVALCASGGWPCILCIIYNIYIT